MSEGTVLEQSVAFLDEYMDRWFASEAKKPLFIFISGPQGSGKSYTGSRINTFLQGKFKDESRSIVYTSIDDFYLTHADQKQLEDVYPDNLLLKGRGLPGTHDMTLLYECVDSVINHTAGETSDLKLPLYDKSKFNGEGDRSDEWKFAKLPVDIFILEGWFLGFNSIIPNESTPHDIRKELAGDMKIVNSNLFMYGDLLWNNEDISSFGIALCTDDVVKNAHLWRLEQEHETIAKFGNGMSDVQVKDFVNRYCPSYNLYYNSFVQGERLGSIATLTLGIDVNRQVVSSKIRSIE